MSPDFVLFDNVFDQKNYEFFFMEVKGWPHQSNKGETDTLKLEKQLQIALNKFVSAGIDDPILVSLLVKGNFLLYLI
jgi:hypothetical protein